MNPVDAVRLALEARAMDAGELRALAERCVVADEPDVAELAWGFAAVAEASVATVDGQKKVDTPTPNAHGRP